jgi:hypothetical protein
MKGKKHNKHSKKKMSESRKGQICGPIKISKQQTKNILNEYSNKPYIHIEKNIRGKQLSYDGAFCRLYCKKYNVTEKAIKNIITNKTLFSKSFI